MRIISLLSEMFWDSFLFHNADKLKQISTLQIQNLPPLVNSQWNSYLHISNLNLLTLQKLLISHHQKSDCLRTVLLILKWENLLLITAIHQYLKVLYYHTFFLKLYAIYVFICLFIGSPDFFCAFCYGDTVAVLVSLPLYLPLHYIKTVQQ